MKLIKISLFLTLIYCSFSQASTEISFDQWKMSFKKLALQKKISEKTFDLVMSEVSFLQMSL